MGAVPAQPDHTGGRVDGELDPGAPPHPVHIPRHWFDHRIQPERGQIEAGQALELLAHHSRFEPPLLGEGDVLEVATTAYPGMRTGRTHPLRRCDADLDDIGPQEGPTRIPLRDPGQHPLPRQSVPDEDDLTVEAGDAVPAVGDRPDLELDDLADHRPSPRRTSPGAESVSGGS